MLLVSVAVLLTHSAQAESPAQVIAKVVAAYKQVKSAEVRTRFIVHSPRGRLEAVTELVYLAPNLVHSTMKTNAKGLSGFTYISDGNRVQTIGRKGQDGIKPFSLQRVQDDGPPVYKETLCLWDAERQWNTKKGGRFEGYVYELSKDPWNGKTWTTLMEMRPGSRDGYVYFIDPKTHLIKRTLQVFLDSTEGYAEYVVERFEPHIKVDRGRFKIPAK